MAYVSPIPGDLSTLLGADLDPVRAGKILDLAESLCKSVVSPLPDNAGVVVLGVAARAFSNPQNAESLTTGPYTVGYGPVSGGLWLTRGDKAALRRFAGGGGAFTVDPTPADAGPADFWAQSPETVAEVTSSPPYYGDFDQP